MRILILGNNYSAIKFFKFFEKNSENIVFSTIQSFKNNINFNEIQDVVDFCEANDINLVVITDENYIDLGYQEAISALNISAFAPTIEAVSISASKAYAKRFIYKNKIKTPKFSIFEKPTATLEYLKQTNYPIAIKPDSHSFQECCQFCETFAQAQKAVNNFFDNGNKKIIIEDYIEGKNFTLWTLSDGYSAKIIASSANYLNEISLFEPYFVNEELKENLLNNVILPLIKALSEQDEEYIGILGFDFIQTRNNENYLVGFNSFFDDLNVDFYLNGFDVDWAKVFDSTIVGDVFLKYDFKPKDEFMLTIRQNEKIHFISSRTKNNLEKYLEELELDTKLYKEANKIWKS